MLDSINTLIDSAMASPWAYLAVLVVCCVDAFFPPIPSETVVIAAAAVAAAGGAQSIPWILFLAAAGAFLGDHISYAVGRVLGARAVRRLLSGERGRAAQARTRRALQLRGGLIIVAARFIPGGRTATTLTAGALLYPLARFAVFDAVAASSWAVYAVLIGYFAGGLFEGNLLLAVAVGIVMSIGISLVVETVRLLIRRRRNRRTRRERRAAGAGTGLAHPGEPDSRR